MVHRDRDESGRPRSARPRDALGRPLRQGSEGIPRIPDDLRLSPAETLVYAQDLLDRGLAFNAHEVLEAAWKSGPAEERGLWQGLAQLMVGITHVQRGNVKGAITVLRRAAAGLAHEAGRRRMPSTPRFGRVRRWADRRPRLGGDDRSIEPTAPVGHPTSVGESPEAARPLV